MAGAKPNFNSYDVLRCFLLLPQKRSRAEACEILGLGEGMVRTILDHLKSLGLVESDRGGHEFSKKGDRFYSDYLQYYDNPQKTAVPKLSGFQTGILVLKPNIPLSVIAARDAAVREGARGAFIFLFDGKLRMPPVEAGPEYAPLAAEFKMALGQALVIAYGETRRAAENGALSAAMKLSRPFSLQ